MIETTFHFNDEVQIVNGFYKGAFARVYSHRRDTTVTPYVDYYIVSITGHTLNLEFTEADFIDTSETLLVPGGGGLGGNP